MAEAVLNSSFHSNQTVRDVSSSAKVLNSPSLCGRFSIANSHCATFSSSKPMKSPLKASIVFADCYKLDWPLICSCNYDGFTYNLSQVYIDNQRPKKQRQRTSRIYSRKSKSQPQTAMDTIVIFDFDSTIIDVDSDPWVAKQLGLMHVMDELINTQMPWNDMMEVFMGEVHQQGKTIADVENALRSAPLQPSKISAIRKAYDLRCDLRIVSDANYFFIKTILDKYGSTQLFTHIITNPSSIDENGRIHIQPFHPKSAPPHGCPLCPPNMCKGVIIEDILKENASKRIIYVGDGSGDYCPSLRLRSTDSVLPREGYPLFELLKNNMDILKASVRPWNSSEDMEDRLLNTIKFDKHQAEKEC